MTEPASIPPSLPNYSAPKGIPPPPHPKQQAPLNKLMGKMLAKHLPRLMNKGKIAPQSVKIGHKKQKEKAIYY
jgi:hypothetical protein